MESFNDTCFIMIILGVVVWVSLYFVDAGYGKMTSEKWGPAINNKIGWMLMECPVFLVVLYFWAKSPVRFDVPYLLFFLFFELHYLHRTFIAPLLMRGKSKMPLAIMFFSVAFNLVLFFGGMAINWQSDYIIRHLRKPGDTKHYLPKGGLYNYVTSANYLGEIIEWMGWAMLTWSLAGFVFFFFTMSNLVPRSNSIYKKYQNEFADEFEARRPKLKRILPFIY